MPQSMRTLRSPQSSRVELPVTTPELIDALRLDRYALMRDALLWQRGVRYASLVALVAQYTLRTPLIKIVLWAYVVLVTISTTYFGWHYIADDIAGLAIALVSVYLAALGTGQKFDRRGRSSHPTTSTSETGRRRSANGAFGAGSARTAGEEAS